MRALERVAGVTASGMNYYFCESNTSRKSEKEALSQKKKKTLGSGFGAKYVLRGARFAWDSSSPRDVVNIKACQARRKKPRLWLKSSRDDGEGGKK